MGGRPRHFGIHVRPRADLRGAAGACDRAVGKRSFHTAAAGGAMSVLGPRSRHKHVEVFKLVRKRQKELLGVSSGA